MQTTNTSFRYPAPTILRQRLSARFVVFASTVLVWAAVAYSAVGWWLRDAPVSVNTSSHLASATPATDTLQSPSVARALGAQATTAPAPPTQASRFQLMGVLNAEGGAGVALISVDGKPAKPYAVGKAVADGLWVQSTQAKRVSLGASAEGPSTLSLELPSKNGK